MESSQAQKVDIEALNFGIRTEPLETFSDSQVYQADQYLAIYGRDSLLGIKARREYAQLILNHYQAYQLGESLYKQLFSPGMARVCFLTENKNWMASLIGEELTGKSRFSESQQSLFVENHRINQLVEDLHYYGFKPSLGVVNGFDYNDNLAFYLLVEPTELQVENIPVLTLASFKFNERQQHEIALLPSPLQESHALSILRKKAQPVFSKALEEFLALYHQLSQWPLDRQSLTAISLDLYNKNRNIASIAVDPQLAGYFGDTVPVISLQRVPLFHD